MGGGASISVNNGTDDAAVQARLNLCKQEYHLLMEQAQQNQGQIFEKLSQTYSDVLPCVTITNFPEFEQFISMKEKLDQGPIFVAIRKGDLAALLTELKKEGIDVDQKERDEGKTPLIVACRMGKDGLPLITALIKHGANSIIKDRFGLSPLHYAAYGGHLEVCQYLLDHGSTLEHEAKDGNGWTALLYAIDGGHTQLALHLIEKGANMKISEEEGKMTSLHIAINRGLLRVVTVLIEQGGLDIEQVDGQGRSPLRMAASLGNLEIVQYLVLSRKAIIDATNSEGETALYLACSAGHLPVVEFLVVNGGNTQQAAKSGTTPLLSSVDSGYPLVTRFLLNTGCNVNSKTGTGRTALIRSAQYGHLEVTKALLADPDLQKEAMDNDGRTALIFAALRNYMEVVVLLVESGCDIEARDHDDKAAVDLTTSKDVRAYLTLRLEILNKKRRSLASD